MQQSFENDANGVNDENNLNCENVGLIDILNNKLISRETHLKRLLFSGKERSFCLHQLI